MGLVAGFDSFHCDPHGVGRGSPCGQIGFCCVASFSPRWGCGGQTKSSEEELVGSLAYRESCCAHASAEMARCEVRLAMYEQGEGGAVDEKCS
jgi:hypothetical protein